MHVSDIGICLHYLNAMQEKKKRAFTVHHIDNKQNIDVVLELWCLWDSSLWVCVLEEEVRPKTGYSSLLPKKTQ